MDKLKSPAQKKRAGQNDDDGDLEMTMEMPAWQAINTAGSVFDRALDKRFGGINTRQSVFDRQAVFKTQDNDAR